MLEGTQCSTGVTKKCCVLDLALEKLMLQRTWFCAKQRHWTPEENIRLSSVTEPMNPDPPENFTAYLNLNMWTSAYSWSRLHMCGTLPRCLSALMHYKAELQMPLDNGTKSSYGSEKCWRINTLQTWEKLQHGHFLKGEKHKLCPKISGGWMQLLAGSLASAEQNILTFMTWSGRHETNFNALMFRRQNV